MVKKGIEMFWKSEKIEALVNDYARYLAEEVYGCDDYDRDETAFLGFHIDRCSDGDEYICALYDTSAGILAVTYCDGVFDVETNLHHTVMHPA